MSLSLRAGWQLVVLSHAKSDIRIHCVGTRMIGTVSCQPAFPLEFCSTQLVPVRCVWPKKQCRNPIRIASHRPRPENGRRTSDPPSTAVRKVSIPGRRTSKTKLFCVQTIPETFENKKGRDRTGPFFSLFPSDLPPRGTHARIPPRPDLL